jgi:hypothetical protein
MNKDGFGIIDDLFLQKLSPTMQMRDNGGRAH